MWNRWTGTFRFAPLWYCNPLIPVGLTRVPPIYITVSMQLTAATLTNMGKYNAHLKNSRRTYDTITTKQNTQIDRVHVLRDMHCRCLLCKRHKGQSFHNELMNVNDRRRYKPHADLYTRRIPSVPITVFVMPCSCNMVPMQFVLSPEQSDEIRTANRPVSSPNLYNWKQNNKNKTKQIPMMWSETHHVKRIY